VGEADLLLHVVDIADEDYEEQMRAVEQILAELGLAQVPRLLVFNKRDRLPPAELARRLRGRDAVAISATDPQTTEPLLARMEAALWRAERPAS